MDRGNIDKIAQTQEDKILLAKVWDKIQSGIRKNIPANTCFLTPRELEMTQYLFGKLEGLCAFGGYWDAERKMLVYLPEYLDENHLTHEESPLTCLRATFFQEDSLSHRDFLGALMGSGIAREAVGDICVGSGTCDFFVTSEIAPYILGNFESAGRTKLRLTQIPLEEVSVPEAQTQEIRDTVASLRFDNVISAGFRVSRTIAAEYIAVGKAAMDDIPCEKADKPATEGQKISVRGLGKIKIRKINGQTKKGRFSLIIDRYV